MRELRLLWLLCIVLIDAVAVGGRSVKKKHPVKGEQGKRSRTVNCKGNKKGNIDATHIAQFGDGCRTDSQSLAQFTTLHPSEQGNGASAVPVAVSAAPADSPSPSKVSADSKIESKTTDAVTKVKDKALKVSSDKVHNGGRKGPMSGAQNQGSSVPVSILIPFPIIPVQGQGNAMGGVPAQQGGAAATGPKKQKKVEKSNSDSNKKYGKRIGKKHQGMVNAHLIQLTNRQENASADVPTGNISIERLKRESTQVGESSSLTDEERVLRDKWLHPNEEDLIPGAENNYYDAADVSFIEKSQANFENHMAQVWPILRKYKRTLFDEEGTGNSHVKVVRETRGADDNPLVVEAKRKLAEAEKAAQALTNIEVEVGVDPMNLVENTHRYVTKLNADKTRYDTAIRSHIVEVGQAIRRSMLNNGTGHNETSVLNDINGAKRQLEVDRRQLEEVNSELGELKDIELMAAGLEVAKYVARERALENLAAARSSIEHAPEAPPPPAAPVAAPKSEPEPPPPAPPPPPPRPQYVAPPPAPRPYVAPPAPRPAAPAPRPQYVAPPPQPRPYVAPAPPPAPVRPYAPPVPVRPYAGTMEQTNFAPPPQGFMYPPHQAAQRPAAMESYSPYQQNTYMYPQYNTAPNMLYAPNMAQYTNSYPSRMESMLSPNERVNPMSVVNPFSSAKAKVGKPDHETKIEHKTEDDKNDDSHDWGGMLTFPGTTYSPPPTWLQGQAENTDQYAREPQGSQAPNTQQNPVATSTSSQAVPIANPAPYRPVTPEISQPEITQPAGVNAIVTTQDLNQPYSLSEAIASTLRRPNEQGGTPTQPKVAQTSDVKDAVAAASYIKNQNAYNNNNNNPARNAQLNFANTNNNGGSTSAGEVIQVTPQDETYTIHNARTQQQSVAPAPIAPIAVPSTTSSNFNEGAGSTLPGWMGAVDGAKYDHDVSDRLRQQNSQVQVVKGYSSSNNPEKEVKEDVEKVKKAEGKYKEVQVASKAVSGIENAVGLDSESIVKMIDFVKRSAIDDVKQSTDIVNKDINVLKDIKESIALKKSNVGASDTPPLEKDNVAFTQAKTKLKDGEQNLAEARDRLDKIKKMEMLVTGIEVAKYYAAEKAAMEVQGSKRNLQEAIKRTRVPQALATKLSVINKKH